MQCVITHIIILLNDDSIIVVVWNLYKFVLFRHECRMFKPRNHLMRVATLH
jgi:hypothetical protein